MLPFPVTFRLAPYPYTIKMAIMQWLFAITVFTAVLNQVQGKYSEEVIHDPIAKRDSVPAGYDAKPYYPTPQGGWASSWTAAYAKAAAVVANMTLAEKVNLTTGTGIYFVRFLIFQIFHGPSRINLCAGAMRR